MGAPLALAKLVARPVAWALLVAGLVHLALATAELPLAMGPLFGVQPLHQAVDEKGLTHLLVPVRLEGYTLTTTPLALMAEGSWLRIRVAPEAPGEVVDCTIYLLSAANTQKLVAIHEEAARHADAILGTVTVTSLVAGQPSPPAITLQSTILPYSAYTRLVEKLAEIADGKAPCSTGVEMEPSKPYIALVELTVRQRPVGPGPYLKEPLHITISYGINPSTDTMARMVLAAGAGALLLLLDYRSSPWLYRRLLQGRRKPAEQD